MDKRWQVMTNAPVMAMWATRVIIIKTTDDQWTCYTKWKLKWTKTLCKNVNHHNLMDTMIIESITDLVSVVSLMVWQMLTTGGRWIWQNNDNSYLRNPQPSSSSSSPPSSSSPSYKTKFVVIICIVVLVITINEQLLQCIKLNCVVS